jgi:hypothetical protein
VCSIRAPVVSFFSNNQESFSLFKWKGEKWRKKKEIKETRPLTNTKPLKIHEKEGQVFRQLFLRLRYFRQVLLTNCWKVAFHAQIARKYNRLLQKPAVVFWMKNIDTSLQLAQQDLRSVQHWSTLNGLQSTLYHEHYGSTHWLLILKFITSDCVPDRSIHVVFIPSRYQLQRIAWDGATVNVSSQSWFSVRIFLILGVGIPW